MPLIAGSHSCHELELGFDFGFKVLSEELRCGDTVPIAFNSLQKTEDSANPATCDTSYLGEYSLDCGPDSLYVNVTSSVNVTLLVQEGNGVALLR